MKTIKLLMSIAIAGAMAMVSSCKEDEVKPAEIKIDPMPRSR